jgi:hypothetical protein
MRIPSVLFNAPPKSGIVMTVTGAAKKHFHFRIGFSVTKVKTIIFR